MLRTAALAIFLIASQTVVSECSDDTLPIACFDWNDFRLDLGPENCRSSFIQSEFRKQFKVKKDALTPSDPKCKQGFKDEVAAIMRTTTFEAALSEITDKCESALQDAVEANTKTVGWGISANLQEYFDGEGALNKETGNFQQTTNKFLQNGGYEQYLTIETDPRLNDHYPTTEDSYQAGVEVNNTYTQTLMKRYLEAPPSFQNGCPDSNTVMCCWHRDRQYFDNNGDCKPKDCARQNPGDNTDLCWTESDDTIFPYPGDETEKDLHCHGISWGDDSVNDVQSWAKWNNLFYVSLYDHMYERGYVESLTGDVLIEGEIPMCGCIEDMAPVARADCQQVVASANYTVIVDLNTSELVINPVADTFEMEFEACEGYKFDDAATPADYEVEKDDMRAQNNDLAGFIFKLWLQQKLSDDKVDLIKETLIGYERSDLGNNDNRREEACEEAFNLRFPDLNYEEGGQPAPDNIFA